MKHSFVSFGIAFFRRLNSRFFSNNRYQKHNYVFRICAGRRRFVNDLFIVDRLCYD